jgi:hypothetical protein
VVNKKKVSARACTAHVRAVRQTFFSLLMGDGRF